MSFDDILEQALDSHDLVQIQDRAEDSLLVVDRPGEVAPIRSDDGTAPPQHQL